MTINARLRATLGALAVAATLASTAFAGGEPKNEAPFTRPVQATPTAVAANDGFDWAAGTIGAGAALGTALAAAGAVTLARHRPSRTTRTAH